MRTVDELFEEAPRVQPAPRALEAKLRTAYPGVRVVASDVLAAEREEVWVIFRDGSPAPAPLDFE